MSQELLRRRRFLLAAAGLGLVLALTGAAISRLTGSPAADTESARRSSGVTTSSPAVTPSPGKAASGKRGSTGSPLVAELRLKRRAAAITSTFENGTTTIQYAWADNIGDGRGITAGRAGFTSATSDLLLVVERYTKLKPGNVLASYIPALKAVNGTSSEQGLDGFTAAWAKAAKDPVLRRVQDEAVDELYFHPAMKIASGAGVTSALGEAIIWDTMIQHGSGGSDGTLTIVRETTSRLGTADGNESAWLRALLDVRQRHLDHMYGSDTSSVSRMDALRSLISKGKLNLDLPLTWTVYGDTFSLSAPED